MDIIEEVIERKDIIKEYLEALNDKKKMKLKKDIEFKIIEVENTCKSIANRTEEITSDKRILKFTLLCEKSDSLFYGIEFRRNNRAETRIKIPVDNLSELKRGMLKIKKGSLFYVKQNYFLLEYDKCTLQIKMPSHNEDEEYLNDVLLDFENGNSNLGIPTHYHPEEFQDHFLQKLEKEKEIIENRGERGEEDFNNLMKSLKKEEQKKKEKKNQRSRVNIDFDDIDKCLEEGINTIDKVKKGMDIEIDFDDLDRFLEEGGHTNSKKKEDPFGEHEIDEKELDDLVANLK